MDENNNSLEPVSSSVPAVNQTSFNIASLNLAENNPYVTVVPTGSTVSAYPFERLKFEQGRQARFAILTSDVVVVKRFYHPELGYVLAPNDGSIDHFFEKSPSVVYLYPILAYLDVDSKGRPLSDKVQVKMLVCNKDMYTSISTLHEVKGDITMFDFVGTQIPGNDKFPKTQILECGPAIWRNSSKIAEYIEDYMKTNGDRFLASVGKSYTPDKLEELLGSSTSAKDDVAQDLDDIFKPM